LPSLDAASVIGRRMGKRWDRHSVGHSDLPIGECKMTTRLEHVAQGPMCSSTCGDGVPASDSGSWRPTVLVSIVDVTVPVASV
jgi:hypothetical protein